jgi:hypothetical protein
MKDPKDPRIKHALMLARYKVYFNYIKQSGGSILITRFDEDFKPIGSYIRRDMKLVNIIKEKDGKIYLKG